MIYKDEQRRRTGRRVTERDRSLAEQAVREIEGELDDRIGRDCDRLHCNDTIGPCDACPAPKDLKGLDAGANQSAETRFPNHDPEGKEPRLG